ncbi:Bug family tripartite tricarboxylate transporter substrate binding protein [Cupriavidus sp. CuC1]|uniref:Bug family tripartite tricarboxylate transporter substrate binding protein n=1 Tax=Cupriavidus sp. CuC1 TaxID=3373131 RepID=UPI0037CF988C
MRYPFWRPTGLFLSALALVSLQAMEANAEEAYPSRPVKIVVPFAAGGSTDLQARQVANVLSRHLKQGFVVENRPGGSGDIGAAMVARANNDGYTLLFTTTNLTANAAQPVAPSYNPEKDFTPVTMVAFAPMLLVTSPNEEADSVATLISRIRARPRQYNFSSSGVGGAPHLAAVLFSRQAKLDMVHVPYNGAVPALTDVAAGNVQLSFTTYVSAEPFVSAKRLKVMAVAGSRRLAVLPDVPTLAQSGVPDVEIGTMFGLLGPAGMPKERVQRLFGALREEASAAGFRRSIEAMGADVVLSAPDDYARYISKDVVRWKTLLKQVGDIQ